MPDFPTVTCPYCGEQAECDWIHNGVGYEQCGSYGCHYCQAVAIGLDDDERPLSEREIETGWYEPTQEVA